MNDPQEYSDAKDNCSDDEYCLTSEEDFAPSRALSSVFPSSSPYANLNFLSRKISSTRSNNAAINPHQNEILEEVQSDSEIQYGHARKC